MKKMAKFLLMRIQIGDTQLVRRNVVNKHKEEEILQLPEEEEEEENLKVKPGRCQNHARCLHPKRRKL